MKGMSRLMLAVLTALAMVASLCAVAAAPASAATDISDSVSISLSDNGPGETGITHTVSFTTATDATSSSGGSVSIEADLADDIGNVSSANVSVTPASLTDSGGNTCTASISVASGNVITAKYSATSGETVTLSADTDVTVKITNTTNPSNAGTYTDSVTTYKDSTSVDTGSADFVIPGFNVSPTSGTVGALVEVDVVVSSSGLTEQPIKVYYAGSEVPITPSDAKTATQTGEISKVYFEVPDSTNGGHDIDVKVGLVSLKSSSDIFNVQPKVTIDPTSGPKGSSATAKCTGFAAGLSIDVTAGGTKVGSSTTNDKGTATVSCTMDAKGTIKATDGAGNSDTDGTFSFEPGITLDPTSGPVGTIVTVSASEFSNADNATKINEGDFTIAGTSITAVGKKKLGETDSVSELTPGKWIVTETPENGAFELKFQVPADLSTGTKEVSLTTTNPSHTATATFTVEAASMSLDPSKGPIGKTVTVSASGLPADQSCDLYFEGANTIKEGLSTDSEGKLSTSFEVPSDVATGEDHTVALKVNDNTLVSAEFHVISTKLSISPEEGQAGTEVTVTGKAYPASESFSIAFEDAAGITHILQQKVTTTTLGAFQAKVTIPSDVALGEGHIWCTADKGIKKAFKVTAPAAKVGVKEGMDVGGVWDKLSGSVWYFDNATKGWRQYYKANPGAVPEESRLTSLKSGSVYWVNVTQDCTLKYAGETISLTKGWNLVTWP